MAGYTYNFRNNPPEYSQGTDSTYGTQGTNTPGAQQNQQTISSQSKTGGTDAYTMFRDAPMSWPVPGQKQAAPSQPQQQGGLAAVLGGGAVPQTATKPPTSMPPNFSAQSLSSVLSGAPITAIPPVPSFWSSAASTVEGPGGPIDKPSDTPAGGGDPNVPGPPGTTPPAQTTGRGRAVAPVNPDPYHFDSNGKPWGPDNLPPKPPGTEDPAVWAEWARKFNFLDPTLYNITKADVDAFRTSGYNPPPDVLAKTPMQNAFIAWWQNGKPTPAQTPPPAGPPPATTTPIVSNWTDPAGNKPVLLGNTDPNDPNYARMQAASGQPAPAAPGTTPPPPAGTPPAGTPPPPTTTPPRGAPPDPNAPPAITPNGQQPIDVASVMRNLYDPQFKQQQSELARVLRSEAAFQDPNLPSSGGFQESLGRAESTLVGNQGAKLAEYTNQALDRSQQLAIAQMDDATRRFGIKSNDDLQRWLNSADSNTIQKLGIDKNDLLQRYIKELDLQGIKYSADQGVNAAALHAAAASASAGASSAIAAQETAAKLQMFGEQNKLDWAQLQANLYMSGQQNYVTELGFLMNSGLSSADALAILGIFGGSTPVFVNP